MENTEPSISAGPTAEGVRYHKLLSVLDRSLAAVVDTFQLKDLQAIFPDLALEIPQKLADSHEQISSYLRNSANADFQAILMQYDMATKLADLDGLVKGAIERRQMGTGRPVSSMTPDAINRGRSVAIKRVELARLKDKLVQVQGENSKSIVELGNQQAMLDIEHRAIKETMELVSQI